MHRMEKNSAVDLEIVFKISSTCHTLDTADLFDDLLDEIGILSYQRRSRRQQRMSRRLVTTLC